MDPFADVWPVIQGWLIAEPTELLRSRWIGWQRWFQTHMHARRNYEGCIAGLRISDESDRQFRDGDGNFGNATGQLGNLTERSGRQDWRCA